MSETQTSLGLKPELILPGCIYYGGGRMEHPVCSVTFEQAEVLSIDPPHGNYMDGPSVAYCHPGQSDGVRYRTYLSMFAAWARGRVS